MIPLTHLSFSAVKDIEACLALTHATRIAPLGIPEVPDAQRDRGTLAHKMIELATLAIARQETLSDGKLRDRIALKAMMGSPLTHNAAYEEAGTIYRRWLETFTINANDIFAVERDGECRIDGVPIPLIGRDDLVHVTMDDGGELYVAIDWKTRFSATVTPQDELQGDLAGLRFTAEYPDKRFASQVGFPRLGLTSPLRHFTAERKAAAEARVRRAWVALVEADASGSWPATPGEGCKFCPIAVPCAKRALTEGVGLTISSQGSAEDALRLRILFSEASKRLTAPMQAWVRDNGPVTVGRAQAGYTPSESRAITDATAALDRLTFQEREKLAPALKLNGKLAAVKRLLDDERIADLVVTKTNKPKWGVTGTSADLEAEPFTFDGDEEEGDDA